MRRFGAGCGNFFSSLSVFLTVKRGRGASRLFTEGLRARRARVFRAQQQPQLLSVAPPTLPQELQVPQPLLKNSSRMSSRIIMQEQLLLFPDHIKYSPHFAGFCSILCGQSEIGGLTAQNNFEGSYS